MDYYRHRLGPQEGYDSYVEEEEGYDRCVLWGGGAGYQHLIWCSAVRSLVCLPGCA
jgi:hypothetical protein